MSEDKDRSRPDPAHSNDGQMSEAEIDKSLMESFPASDPPPWTLGMDHQTESTAPPPAQQREQKK